jgi:hypothetical protein
VPKKPGESCETCQFWEPMPSESRPHLGECHHDTPREPASGNMGRWYDTRDDDWCGQFKAD